MRRQISTVPVLLIWIGVVLHHEYMSVTFSIVVGPGVFGLRARKLPER